MFDLLSKNLGQEAMHYNPPFIYSMTNFTTSKGSRMVVAGLGNGMLLRFKRKGLQLEEICGSTGHGDQISGLIIEEAHKMLVTASHDLSLAYHRIGDGGEQLIEKTLLRVKVENKVNDIVSHDHNVEKGVMVADTSSIISKFIVRY